MLTRYHIHHGMWRGNLPGAKNISLGRLYTIFLAFWFFAMLIGVIMYLKKYKDGDIYDIAAPCTDVFLLVVTEIVIFIIQTNAFEEQLERYYREIHLAAYKYHDDTTKQVLHIVEERCLMLFKALHALFIIGVIFYGTMPVAINILNGAYNDHTIPLETSQYILLPFEYKYDTTNWAYATVIFTFNTFTLSYLIVYFDMLTIFIVIHLVGHIEILKNNISSLARSMDEKKVILTEEEDNEVHEMIRRIVDHHNSVLGSLDLLKRCYGPVILAAYGYDTVAICILLLVLLQNPLNFFRYGGLAVAITVQLGGQSFAMEQMSTSVEELHEAIAAVPWYAMSRRNKRAVNIMIMVSQRPFVFNASGIVKVNLQTMAAIIKSSLSYYLWLNAMGQNE